MSHPTHSNAPGDPRAFDNTSKLVAIAIGVIAGVAGLVVGIVNPFMSDAASTQGALIDVLFGITLGLATAVFVIVQGFLLYSIIRFGREPGDETDAVAGPRQHPAGDLLDGHPGPRGPLHRPPQLPGAGRYRAAHGRPVDG